MVKIPGFFKGFLDNVLNQLRRKDFFREDFRRLPDCYPLYRLAPVVDRGTRLVRLDRIFQTAGQSAQDSNIIHYPRHSNFFASLLSLLGLETRLGRKPAVEIIKIESRYFVFRGRLGVRLAALFGHSRFPAQVVVYNYAALKKKMWVLLRREGALACLAGKQKWDFIYRQLSSTELSTLLRIHRVPCVDLRDQTPVPPTVHAVPIVPAGGKFPANPEKRHPGSGPDGRVPGERRSPGRHRSKVIPIRPSGRLPGAGRG